MLAQDQTSAPCFLNRFILNVNFTVNSNYPVNAAKFVCFYCNIFCTSINSSSPPPLIYN